MNAQPICITLAISEPCSIMRSCVHCKWREAIKLYSRLESFNLQIDMLPLNQLSSETGQVTADDKPNILKSVNVLVHV